MAIADTILATFGFASAAYGLALLAAWFIPSLSGLSIMAPRSWRSETHLLNKRLVIARAGYTAAFGLFIGCQAIGQHLLAVIFAVPTIVFAIIWIEYSIRSRGPRTDA